MADNTNQRYIRIHDVLDPIFDKAKKGLRRERGEKSYLGIFTELINEYLTCLSSISDSFFVDFCQQTKDSFIDAIKKESELLRRVFENYLQGNIAEAICGLDEVLLRKDVMKFVKLNKNIGASASKYKFPSTWYRARLLSKNDRQFSCNEMFHIPFEKRGNVKNYRYSITGLPCLYLGNSVLACWNEMHKPNISDLAVSRFSIEKTQTDDHLDILLLDLRLPMNKDIDPFGIREIAEDDICGFLRCMSTWPLIVACSIKTAHPDDDFKPEYVIPQLVMLSLLRQKNIYGVTYTSTQADNTICENDENNYNIAIPARSLKDNGCCDKLTEVFYSTRGVSYTEADIKNVFNAVHVEDNALVIGASLDSVDYKYTKFGQFESFLEHVDTEKISI